MSDTPLPKPSQPQSSAPQPLQPNTTVSVGTPSPAASAPTMPAPATSPQVPAAAKPTPPAPKPVVAPAPAAPTTTQVPAKPQMPPTTLTALSSMSSTNVPPESQQPTPPPQQFAAGAGTKATIPTAAVQKPVVAASKPAAAAVSQAPSGSSPLPQSRPAGAAPTLAQAATAPAAPAGPAIAQPRKSVLRYLPMILGGVVLLGVIAFAASRFLGGGTTQPADTSDVGSSTNQPQRTTVPAQQTTLEYWGLWEPSEVLSSVIATYEKEHPGVKINYTKQAHQNYRERLETAVSSGTGPDIFRFHAAWTPMLGPELAPLPSSVMTSAEFKTTYYPVVSQQLQYNGQYVGVPLMYDGLALLYNKDILDTAGAQPPTTWAELSALAARLTVRSGDTVQRAGVALGNSANVEHFSDILALLMLQNGADFTKPNSPEVRDALLFYTKFMRTDRVWNATLPPSTVAFARGDAAMVFAPSWRIHEIQARNPNLKIGVAPVPKLSDDRIAWATYWAEGVNAKSKKTAAAFEFLKYLSSKEVLQQLYSEASKVRGFGELYPRVDMADLIATNPLVAAYLQDAPYATGWHLSSFTHDNGINDQLIKYYEDAVTAVSTGKSAEDVLLTVDQGTKQVLRQYGVSTNTTK